MNTIYLVDRAEDRLRDTQRDFFASVQSEFAMTNKMVAALSDKTDVERKANEKTRKANKKYIEAIKSDMSSIKILLYLVVAAIVVLLPQVSAFFSLLVSLLKFT